MGNEIDIEEKRTQIIKALQKPGFPEHLKEKDIDNLYLVIKPRLIKVINFKVRLLTYRSEVQNNVELYRRSIEKGIEIHVKNKMKKYLFEHKKWQNYVPIHRYLINSVKYFYDINGAFPELPKSKNCLNFPNIEKVKYFACPVCKSFMIRSKLEETSDGKLYCSHCENFISEFENENYVADRIELCKKMLSHSKKGVKCERCERFVPFSLMDENGILKCPYINCGKECNPKHIMAHPSGYFYNTFHEFNEENYIFAEEENQERSISNIQQINIKIESLKKIIKNQQHLQAKHFIENDRGTIPNKPPNKYIMYDAIYETIEQHPVDTFNYIVRKMSNNDLPLQAIIFQNFSKKMIASLPVSFSSRGKKITIIDPIDNKLNLFTGFMEFTNTVDENLILRKETVLSRFQTESDKQFPYMCSFIGLIKRVYDENNNNLMEHVENYGFTSLKFKKGTVEPGEVVTVKYFAIPAHYSVKSMAHMQRIIKKINKSCTNRKL